ncbi:MAG TPA: hypothetical protein VNH18_09930, partial [Bryobacteraceae bacterium]|nr:hypothetical protein [Bryobacteraceae bacterium]
MELSRPVHAWEFADANGPRAGVFGTEQGTFEAYVYPLKVFRDLRLVFRSDDRVIPGATIARRIVSTPGAYTVVYSADDFRVAATLAVPVNAAGGLIQLQVEARNPVRIDVVFARDFQLMWPASFGSGFGEWNPQQRLFRFGADGQPYAAVLGSPDATLERREYATNYSADAESSFSLGTIKGTAGRVIAFAASLKSLEEALSIY